MTETAPRSTKINYELIDPVTGDAIGHYTGRQPRQAALKAARTHTEIILRVPNSGNGRGIKGKLHAYKGECKEVPKPKSAPEWIKGDTVKMTNVCKVGVFTVPSVDGLSVHEATAEYLKANPIPFN